MTLEADLLHPTRQKIQRANQQLGGTLKLDSFHVGDTKCCFHVAKRAPSAERSHQIGCLVVFWAATLSPLVKSVIFPAEFDGTGVVLQRGHEQGTVEDCSLISFRLSGVDGVRGYRPRFLMSALETTGTEAIPLWLNRRPDFPPTADLQLMVPEGVFSPMSARLSISALSSRSSIIPQQQQHTLPHQVGDAFVFLTSF